jgi:hypothetical protein
LPIRARLPSAAIGSIGVNADPFSVEADGGAGANQIDVTTASPSRDWTWSASGVLPRPVGPPSAAHPGATVVSSWRPSASASGPIGAAPWSVQLAVDRTSVRVMRQPIDIGAGPIGVDGAAAGQTDISRAWSIFAAAHFRPKPSVHLSAWMSDERSLSAGTSNGAAWSDRRLVTRSRLTSSRTFLEIAGGRVRHRHVIGVAFDSQDIAAGGSGRQVDVLDVLATGGGELASRTATRSVAGKHIIESARPGRPWMTGVAWSRETISIGSTPNPEGRVVFGTLDSFLGEPGAAPPVHLQTIGAPQRRAAVNDVALFAERRIVGRAASLTAGIRLSGGTLMPLAGSPRVTAETVRGGWAFRIGAGRFVEPLAVSDVALASPSISSTDWVGDAALASSISPDFTRAGRVMARAGVARRWPRGRASIEETWVLGHGEPVSRRVRTAAGLADIWMSDASLARRQLQLEAAAFVRGVRISGRTVWTDSRDDIDPSGRERARSAGAPVFAAGVNAEIPAMLGVRLTVRSTWRSGAPFDVRSGNDPAGTGLFLDRGGWPRNGFDGPAYSTTDISAGRRFRGLGVTFDAGIRADNVFDRANAARVGRVLDSPVFGRPLAWLPGRTVAAWLSLGR